MALATSSRERHPSRVDRSITLIRQRTAFSEIDKADAMKRIGRPRASMLPIVASCSGVAFVDDRRTF